MEPCAWYSVTAGQGLALLSTDEWDGGSEFVLVVGGRVAARSGAPAVQKAEPAQWPSGWGQGP